jgi:hypothetical protein
MEIKTHIEPWWFYIPHIVSHKNRPKNLGAGHRGLAPDPQQRSWIIFSQAVSPVMKQ